MILKCPSVTFLNGMILGLRYHLFLISCFYINHIGYTVNYTVVLGNEIIVYYHTLSLCGKYRCPTKYCTIMTSLADNFHYHPSSVFDNFRCPSNLFNVFNGRQFQCPTPMSAARGRTLIFEVVTLQYNEEATTLLSLLSKQTQLIIIL